jgi:hypothetical protein
LVKQLTLYSGPHCHLCDQAKAILYPQLSEQGWEMVEVNIRESDALQQEYGMRIPVLALPDGREKGWPFTAAQIGRMLQSASS